MWQLHGVIGTLVPEYIIPIRSSDDEAKQNLIIVNSDVCVFLCKNGFTGYDKWVKVSMIG